MLSSTPSPQVNVGEGSHPERVKVYGPGVEKTGLKANEPTYFTVDCSEAGQGSPRLGVGGGWGPGRVWADKASALAGALGDLSCGEDW